MGKIPNQDNKVCKMRKKNHMYACSFLATQMMHPFVSMMTVYTCETLHAHTFTACKHTCPHTHTYRCMCTHTNTITHTYIYTLSLSLSHCTHTHAHTHTLTHAHLYLKNKKVVKPESWKPQHSFQGSKNSHRNMYTDPTTSLALPVPCE